VPDVVCAGASWGAPDNLNAQGRLGGDQPNWPAPPATLGAAVKARRRTTGPDHIDAESPQLRRDLAQVVRP